MKKKNTLLMLVATLVLTAATLAQNVPNYVPTNGLVGWWPFNGNANDESGNGNNGTLNGAALAIDRFGSSNSAYNFNGNSIISVNSTQSLSLQNQFTISLWVVRNNPNFMGFISKQRAPGLGSYHISGDASITEVGINNDPGGCAGCNIGAGGASLTYNLWHNYIGLWDGVRLKFYDNGNLIQDVIGILDNGNTLFDANFPLEFGRYFTSNYLDGKLDDIGIWNRALTQQEITALYNAVNCTNNTAITPQVNALPTGSTAAFTATTADPNPSYVWQSDLGQGFQTLNNVGNYSGVNSATLNIANIQLSEHNQPVRVISTSGNCIDTSNVALIQILDTCITQVTVYDTLLTTVTDTLMINTLITGSNPPNNTNTIKVFPNPANDHITINYGNFGLMSGYQLKIENALGQQVFQTNITQQSDYLSLASWGGNGLYFVHIINPQGNTIDIRKIVLQ